METKTIYTKIFQLRKEVGKLSKTEENPFYKCKYFDINGLIENIRPLLEKNNLLLLQPIKDGKIYSIIIDIETVEQIESELELPVITDPQKIGSAITYYRRYTLQSLLGLETEDDDGNKASEIKSTITTLQDKTNEKWLNETNQSGNETKEWINVVKAIKDSKITSIADVRKIYKVARATAIKIENLIKEYNLPSDFSNQHEHDNN
jgi:hypothetical protein